MSIWWRVSLALLFLAPSVAARPRAPEVWVDNGACPFECCEYGRWTAVEPVRAYAESSHRAKPIVVIPAGAAVDALTGFVRTRGQTFIVHRAHDRYRPGDRLTVYTYYGEGAFSVWFQGERYTEDLGFSPYGGSGGTRCTNPKQCWGTLQGELRQEWWVQARLKDGRVVWFDEARKFSGLDRCS